MEKPTYPDEMKASQNQGMGIGSSKQRPTACTALSRRMAQCLLRLENPGESTSAGLRSTRELGAEEKRETGNEKRETAAGGWAGVSPAGTFSI